MSFPARFTATGDLHAPLRSAQSKPPLPKNTKGSLKFNPQPKAGNFSKPASRKKMHIKGVSKEQPKDPDSSERWWCPGTSQL